MSESQGDGPGAGALLACAVGLVFLWSGVKGHSISSTFRSVIKGQNPSTDPIANAIQDPATSTALIPTGSAVDVTGAAALGLDNVGDIVVAYAEQQLGKPYVFATSGPATFDCSGLTAAAYKAAGISIPHNSLAQWLACSKVAAADIQPGDIIFYYALVSHCAIYVGNGQLIEASEPGVPVHQIPVYNNTVNPIHGYGRFLG